MELREQIAEAIHNEWWEWAKAIIPELKELTHHHIPYGDDREQGNCHCKTCERIKRWELEMFKPYSELTDGIKSYDRVWANNILALMSAPKDNAYDLPSHAYDEYFTPPVSAPASLDECRLTDAEIKKGINELYNAAIYSSKHTYSILDGETQVKNKAFKWFSAYIAAREEAARKEGYKLGVKHQNDFNKDDIAAALIAERKKWVELLAAYGIKLESDKYVTGISVKGYAVLIESEHSQEVIDILESIDIMQPKRGESIEGEK